MRRLTSEILAVLVVSTAGVVALVPTGVAPCHRDDDPINCPAGLVECAGIGAYWVQSIDPTDVPNQAPNGLGPMVEGARTAAADTNDCANHDH